MENYILILLTVLVVLVIAIVAIGYRKIEHLRTSVNRNTANISAMQSYVSRINNVSRYGSSQPTYTEDIDVSDSESDASDFVSMQNAGSFLASDNTKSQDFDDSSDESFLNPEDTKSEILNKSLGKKEEHESFLEKEGDEEVSNNENLPEETRVIELESDTAPEEKIELEKDDVNENSSNGMKSSSDEDISEVELGAEEEEVKEIELGNEKTMPNKKLPTLPNRAAKEFDTGYRIESENDGFTYEVIERKDGIKRWKKIIEK